MKKTDISRFSACVSAAMVLVLAACSNDKPSDNTTSGSTGPLKLESIIADPKVATPGDTLLLTAVITSSAENQGDFPVYEWSASGGSLIDTNKQSVRWAAPNNTGIFTITAKATNDVNSVSSKTSILVSTGESLLGANAGQLNLIGSGPDFRFLRTHDVKLGVGISTFAYASQTVTDAAAPVRENGTAITYSPDMGWAAYVADTLMVGTTVKPRNIYLTDFASQSGIRFTIDGARLGGVERNVYNNPSFSPNGQLVAYQRWAQAWDLANPDSFHVYIYDRVQQKRTLVTGEYQFPRAFFPTFSTDSKWLVYVLDTDRSGRWDLYGSPMTGNTVDGSIAAAVRMTDTGGALVSGLPKEFATTLSKRPPMAWNPVAPILAIAAADNKLYLVQTTSTGSNVIPVPDVTKSTEVAWSPDGSQVAASYFVTADNQTLNKLATVSAAGVVTIRATGLAGDVLRDLTFSPDGKWLLYRVTRGGGMWFNIVDTGAGKTTDPVPVTATDPVGSSNDYRNAMSLRPAWTSGNLMIYPTWGTSANNTPGIAMRDLSGLVN